MDPLERPFGPEPSPPTNPHQGNQAEVSGSGIAVPAPRVSAIRPSGEDYDSQVVLRFARR
jgi:hypothetical protein